MVFEAPTYAKNDSRGSKAHRVLIVLGPDCLGSDSVLQRPVAGNFVP